MVVAIYFRDPAMTDDPLSKEKFRMAYYELLVELESLGVTGVVVRGQSTYLGGGRFSRHWRLGKTDDPRDYREGGEISADLVFDRGRLNYTVADSAWVVNHPAVQRLTENKLRIWEQFGTLQPGGRVIQGRDDFAHLSPRTHYVGKLPISHSGAGVKVGTVAQLQQHFGSSDYPIVLQEFVETKAGYPGVVNGRHDVRLFVAGGKIVGCSVRPQPMVLGEPHERAYMLALESVPADLIQMTHDIDQFFQDKPRFYSADYFYGNGKWWLIELNATPGLMPHERGPLADVLRGELAAYLKSLAAARRD